MHRVFRFPAAIVLVLSLAACRIEVYDNLSQRDANEMTALLLNAGISAERASKKDGTFTVMVDEDDFAEAVTLIGRSGLPKPQFATIVDVLSDDRLIASPSEERARLNYALSQELSRTVSEIDGVVSARVHLATPNTEPLSRQDTESSASVAIHHRSAFDTAGFVPRIKTLVANAVDGLDYDHVSIALFPTSGTTNTWTDSGVNVKGEFEAPEPHLTERQTPQSVTPAGFVGAGFNPAIAAIILGGLLVLLFAGRSLLAGSGRARARSFEDAKGENGAGLARPNARRRSDR